MSEEAQRQRRFPALSEAGQDMLQFLREHPAAPLYRNQSGHRLDAQEVAQLRVYERDIAQATIGWPRVGTPDWLHAFMGEAFEQVPHYRALGSPPLRFEDLPPVSRADFAADIARFVPDNAPLDKMINFRTTGTTGHPLLVASHPVVAARYLAFHKRALRRCGVELRHGRGQVGVVLLGHQRKCFTYVSVTPLMDESGLAKINLHPDDWRDPAHRAAYLDALNPEVYSGDPLSFAELLTLPLRTRPRALICVSMQLLPGLRAELERRFACPVLDIYSLNEVGPVGVYDTALGGHLLLQPRLYVEILDRAGRPVAPGQRGEITFSGGFNFCLPLLRYRSGDFASLVDTPEGPLLVDLAGRPPVRFRTAAGEWINNIDVSHALGRFALPQFGLHQDADASLRLRLAPNAMHLSEPVGAALCALFGVAHVSVEPIAAEDKIIQYTTDLEGGRL